MTRGKKQQGSRTAEAAGSVGSVTAAPEGRNELEASELASLDPDRLCEHLVQLASEAKRQAMEGHLGWIHRHRENIREAAAVASGEQLRLLEVAEAFLTGMARMDLGQREVALYMFFARHPREADALFARLLEPSPLRAADMESHSDDVRNGVAELVKVGVLRRVGDDLGLSPTMVPIVRELREPAAIRMWLQVERCRKEIGSALRGTEGARYLASHLGITQEQASRYLERYPVSARGQGIERLMIPVHFGIGGLPPTIYTIKIDRRKVLQRVRRSRKPASEDSEFDVPELDMDLGYPDLSSMH